MTDTVEAEVADPEAAALKRYDAAAMARYDADDLAHYCSQFAMGRYLSPAMIALHEEWVGAAFDRLCGRMALIQKPADAKLRSDAVAKIVPVLVKIIADKMMHPEGGVNVVAPVIAALVADAIVKDELPGVTVTL